MLHNITLLHAGARNVYVCHQGRPPDWQVKANASWKKLREGKKLKNGGYFFGSKFPRNAW